MDVRVTTMTTILTFYWLELCVCVALLIQQVLSRYWAAGTVPHSWNMVANQRENKPLSSGAEIVGAWNLDIILPATISCQWKSRGQPDLRGRKLNTISR